MQNSQAPENQPPPGSPIYTISLSLTHAHTDRNGFYFIWNYRRSHFLVHHFQDTRPRTNLRRRGCSLVRKVKEIGASLRDASLLCAAVGSVKHASEQGLQHDPYICQ
ncbi:hypothetical protein O6P43_006434 [Quillaja saponaria]|uniref:Uncharacterized protein n=1 Tax=Quillaja saponaria TaxID=32244 RepID=A0AAD7Q874_QUISA|nr:hypothetical protein O6P43_006434 [Quillaja saponaria]